MGSPSTFMLGGKHISITSAFADCYISEQNGYVAWGFEVHGYVPDAVSGPIEPIVRSESPFRFFRPESPIPWIDSFPRSLNWETSTDLEGQLVATVYVHEHSQIDSGSHSAVQDSGRLHVALTGTALIVDTLGIAQPTRIRIDTEAKFKGIWLGRRPEPECRALLSRFYRDEEFEYSVTADGVSLMRPCFTNSTR